MCLQFSYVFFVKSRLHSQEEDEDVFDDEGEGISEDEEDSDEAGEDAGVVTSNKGPGARSKRMIIDSDEED